MRIIGGEARGRRLFAPSGNDTRPTSDRTRESLFNILSFDIPGSVVLDLFGGTGALALEALSRGASYACVSDKSPQAVKIIERNAEIVLGNEKKNKLSVVSADYKKVLSLFRGRKFTIVFLDPPYAMEESYGEAVSKLIEYDMLTDDALIIMERIKTAKITLPEEMEIFDTRDYRDTVIDFVRWRDEK